MRALPAGPTVTDMLANAAFLIGLTLWLAGLDRRLGPDRSRDEARAVMLARYLSRAATGQPVHTWT